MRIPEGGGEFGGPGPTPRAAFATDPQLCHGPSRPVEYCVSKSQNEPVGFQCSIPRGNCLDGFKGGWIEIIAGGMFSGKSEELIRRLRRAVIARQRVQVFKPLLDDRFCPEEVVTRDDRRLKAIAVPTSDALLSRIEIGAQVIGIDEVQFFDDGIVELCMQLADAGIRVIAAGLDQDYRRKPFGPMPALLAVAEEVSKMHAVCMRCRGAAHYSQRLTGGDDQVQVGDTSYEARCRSCFETYRAETAEEPVDEVAQLVLPDGA
jgi:thymidine kinase